MKLKKYSEEAARTDAPMPEQYDKLSSIHMVMGMTTEVGELTDVFKKNLAYKKPIDWVNAKEEIGDLMWYVVNFCTINGFDISEILQTNIDKLRARYPEKFTSEKAINRDLASERTILERETFKITNSSIPFNND